MLFSMIEEATWTSLFYFHDRGNMVEAFIGLHIIEATWTSLMFSVFLRGFVVLMEFLASEKPEAGYFS